MASRQSTCAGAGRRICDAVRGGRVACMGAVLVSDRRSDAGAAVMGAALAWIAGTRLGRALAAAGALVLAVLAALWAARRGGAKAARAEMAKRRAAAARKAKEKRDEVNSLDA